MSCDLHYPDLIIAVSDFEWINGKKYRTYLVYLIEEDVDWDGRYIYIIGYASIRNPRFFSITKASKQYPIATGSGWEMGGHVELDENFPNDFIAEAFYHRKTILQLSIESVVPEDEAKETLLIIIRNLREITPKLTELFCEKKRVSWSELVKIISPLTTH